ncbi:MAG: hypothetical protein QXS89_07105 [Sulfolobales archaeon]
MNKIRFITALILIILGIQILNIITASEEILLQQPTNTETNTNTTNITTITTTTTQTLTLIVYPLTTLTQSTIIQLIDNTTTTAIINITTTIFTLAPTETYTEYKFISFTTTRPPEITERGAWISAGVIVGVLLGLTIGYAYYARGITIRRRR